MQSAGHFGLKVKVALAVIEHQIQVIKNQWSLVFDEADMSAVDRNLLWGWQIFNPFSVEVFEELVSR